MDHPMDRTTYRYEWSFRPGARLDDQALAALSVELRAVGELCLSPLPDYQVFLGTRAAYADKVLTLARRRDGTLAGFCSAVLLDVPGVGEILHLGLTCVRPEDRSAGLTHRLVSRLVARYLFTRRPFERIWVTNFACVLSSLGNFASHFRDVHPAPGSDARAVSPKAWRIAEAFDRQYRHHAYIRPEATFDPETFVFRGSGRGTAFQKDDEDHRFDHRDEALNRFYRARLRFDDGDEMLQVGTLAITDLVRYAVRGRTRRTRRNAAADRDGAAP
jgi:hypothetical protein